MVHVEGLLNTQASQFRATSTSFSGPHYLLCYGLVLSDFNTLILPSMIPSSILSSRLIPVILPFLPVYSFFFFFFVFLPFLGPLLRLMEVPRLGVESEL